MRLSTWKRKTEHGIIPLKAMVCTIAFKTTEGKASYEKQYAKFRKLLSASNRDIPLSEIMDCIDGVVVGAGKKIVVEWNVNSN